VVVVLVELKSLARQGSRKVGGSAAACRRVSRIDLLTALLNIVAVRLLCRGVIDGDYIGASRNVLPDKLSIIEARRTSREGAR